MVTSTTGTSGRDLAQSYRERRVLVVGAGGFIGSAVARTLSQTGAEVFVLVRDPSRLDPMLRRMVAGVRVASLDGFPEVTAAVTDVSPEITFNLAGYGVRRGEDDKGHAFAVNADGVERIARAVAGLPGTDWSGARLVHVGSQAEYGPGVAMHEDAQCRPISAYGRSKLEGTERLRLLSESEGIPAVTARLFNVYGPGEPRGRLLPRLSELAQRQGRIDLTSGVQERDFTLVNEVAEGLMRLGRLGGLLGEPVNLGTGRLTPVRRFVEIAAQELGISLERLHFGAIPDNADEDRRPQISVDRLKELTAWLPEIEVSDGIARSVESFRT